MLEEILENAFVESTDGSDRFVISPRSERLRKFLVEQHQALSVFNIGPMSGCMVVGHDLPRDLFVFAFTFIDTGPEFDRIAIDRGNNVIRGRTIKTVQLQDFFDAAIGRPFLTSVEGVSGPCRRFMLDDIALALLLAAPHLRPFVMLNGRADVIAGKFGTLHGIPLCRKDWDKNEPTAVEMEYA